MPVAKALEQGHAEIWLEGEKLRGGYAVVHAKIQGAEKNWLPVKMKDEAADARRNPVSTRLGACCPDGRSPTWRIKWNETVRRAVRTGQPPRGLIHQRWVADT